MRCRRVKKRLSLSLDGRLREGERAKIRAHLAGCSRCAREESLLSQTWEMLRDWRDIETAPNFKAEFWQKVAREKSEVRERRKVPVFFPNLWRWSPALVTVATLLLVVGLYFRVLPGRVSEEEMQIAGQLGLLEDMEVIRNLDWLDDFVIIEQVEI